MLAEVEAMKTKNTVSREIPKLKKAGEGHHGHHGRDEGAVRGKIKELDGCFRRGGKLRAAIRAFRNTPYQDVQYGEGRQRQRGAPRKFQEPTTFDFEPKAHWDYR